jgi:repressor LexA
VLSAKQENIIKFIRDFLYHKGYLPSIRDIAKGCGISSTSVVAYNLNKLEAAGYIRRQSDISRGIELLDNRRNNPRTIYIPIIEEIAAGEPIPVPASDSWSVISSEGIEVAEELTKGKQVYALRVKGDSMVDALIKDGDIVLMEYVNDAENGDMVAAWLKEEQEGTLKKFFSESNRVRLKPANSRMKSIYTAPDNVEIQGKVVAVIRRMP